MGRPAPREAGSANRAAIAIDEAALVKSLIDLAAADLNLRLLRVFWYDAGEGWRARSAPASHRPDRLGQAPDEPESVRPATRRASIYVWVWTWCRSASTARSRRFT